MTTIKMRRLAHNQIGSFSVEPTEMAILWLAILFYSVGLAAVLHFRPSLMFHESGAWKEFGYKRSLTERYTMFPIWLFAIVWAVLSYTLAAAIVWSWSHPTTAMMAGTASVLSYPQQLPVSVPEPEAIVEEEEEEEERENGDANFVANMIPVSEVPRPSYTNSLRLRPGATRIQTPARQPRQGYYVIDPASEVSGIRRYVYFGDQPPEEA